MSLVTRRFFALLLAGTAGSAAADSWTRISDVGQDPIVKTTSGQFDVSATVAVDVRNVGGEVEFRVGDGNRVTFDYERRAPTQQDFDCETLRTKHAPDSVRIWVEPKREKACRVTRASDRLRVTVPRGASVEARNIGDSVNVEGVEGMVRLAAIGDSVRISGARQVEAESVGDSLKLEVAKLGPGGVRLSSIGDSVELTLPETVDARLRISSVGNEIRAPGLRLTSEQDDYDGALGKGGPMIRITSVGDTVVIKGPRLTQPTEL